MQSYERGVGRGGVDRVFILKESVSTVQFLLSSLLETGQFYTISKYVFLLPCFPFPSGGRDLL